LWETDVDGYYLAGVEDSGLTTDYKKQLEISEANVCINSGVLLMNLTAWRRDNIIEKIIETSQKLGSKAKFLDQCVINCALSGKIKKIDSHFNWLTYDSENTKRNSSSYRPAIVSHFASHKKPWNPFHKCHHESASNYFRYLRKTPYRNFVYRYWLMRSFKLVLIIWNHFRK
jgi:lipopolysaccharide biosynthesis glycosyltransferase